MNTTKKLVSILCVLIICVQLFAIVASAAKTPNGLPELRKGKGTWSQVNLLQKMLNYANNAGLNPDGVFGNLTYKAVVAYQGKKNLQGDGIVGDRTWNALFTDCQLQYKSGKPYPRGELVRQLQIMLNAICAGKSGYSRISEDGVFGPGTSTAVKYFQEKYCGGYQMADGIVGKNTWTMLIKKYCPYNPAYND